MLELVPLASISPFILAALLQPAGFVAPEPTRLTVTITLPEQVKEPVYIAGNLDPFGPWDPKKFVVPGEGRTRTFEVAVPNGHRFEFKVTLGSWDRQQVDATGRVMGNHVVEPGTTTYSVEVAGFGNGVDNLIGNIQERVTTGQVELWRDVESRHGILKRHVIVWLPPEYAKEPERRFPVLYMHDGQNVIDAALSFAGDEWGIDEAIVRLSSAGRLEPMIVVAPFNSADRHLEYWPYAKGPQYARFLVEELKPRVDSAFRTKPEREHTAVMGSSMGGVISFYLAQAHADTFGRAACVSTHWVYEEDRYPAEIEKMADFPRNVRLYFDFGTVDADAPYEPLQDRVSAKFRQWGWREGMDFIVRKFPGASHNEAAWRARLDYVLLDLFSMPMGEAPKPAAP
jgi:predicted alpha/beta superfamily hydrolase